MNWTALSAKLLQTLPIYAGYAKFRKLQPSKRDESYAPGELCLPASLVLLFLF